MLMTKGMPFCSATCAMARSEEHTSELQSHVNLVCRLLLEKKKKKGKRQSSTGHRLPAWKRCCSSLKHSHGNDQGTGAFRKPPGAGAHRSGLGGPGPSRKRT